MYFVNNYNICHLVARKEKNMTPDLAKSQCLNRVESFFSLHFRPRLGCSRRVCEESSDWLIVEHSRALDDTVECASIPIFELPSMNWLLHLHSSLLVESKIHFIKYRWLFVVTRHTCCGTTLSNGGYPIW